MTLIGISGNILRETSGLLAGYERAYVNDDYVKAVVKAGGVPVILPINDSDAAIESMVSKLDALILSGGHDVSPLLYGENPLMHLGEILPRRDAFDFKLIEYAKKRQIPILGICRGFQILNVYHGGSLYQDLSYIERTIPISHSQSSPTNIKTHKITVDKNSKFYDMVQNESVDVNSFHHQALKVVADDFRVVGRADDGTVEVIEGKDYPWLVAVQFHPEMLHAVDGAMQNVFNHLVEASTGTKE